jgi:biopolymer transport protein ExbD
MLTTSFKPTEAVQVDTPNSISEQITPEKNVITLLISKDNKVFFDLDNGVDKFDSARHIRRKVLEGVAGQYKLKFPEEMIAKFEKLGSFGMPIDKLGEWIESTDPKVTEGLQTGIPMDSVDNQLKTWIYFARTLNSDTQVAIKGDGTSDYKTVKKVLDILQDIGVNKFNLTTNLEKVEAKLEN